MDGKGGNAEVSFTCGRPRPVRILLLDYSPVYTKALRNSTFSAVMATQGTSCFSVSGLVPLVT